MDVSGGSPYEVYDNDRGGRLQHPQAGVQGMEQRVARSRVLQPSGQVFDVPGVKCGVGYGKEGLSDG